MEQANSRADRLRVRLTAAVFVAVLAFLWVANLFSRAPDILQAERRRRAAFPALTIESVFDGGFMDGFEDWAADSFPFRDSFRSLKAGTLFHLFFQLDNNGIFIKDGHAAKIETLNEASVRAAGEKFARLTERYLGNASLHCAVIPDKSTYLGGVYPRFDTERAKDLLSQALPDAVMMDLEQLLSAESYYRTDLHWDQAFLPPVAEEIALAMGAGGDAPAWSATEYAPFYGVYYGQSALPLPADTLTVLNSAALEGVTAKRLDPDSLEMQLCGIYEPERFEGVDPYDIFLGGPQPLVTLTNSKLQNGKDLIIFRDSFASSLAPLLCPYYENVTLVDLRYFAAAAIPLFLEPSEDTDVLFLFGAQVLNNSGTWMV